MFRLLKALPLTLAIAALSFVTTSCGSGNTAQVRLVNAISDDTQGLDIDIQRNEGIYRYRTVPRLRGPRYVRVPSGSDTIQGLKPAPPTQFFTQPSPVSFSAGTQYTMVAAGQLRRHRYPPGSI